VKLRISSGKYRGTQINIPDSFSDFRPAKGIVREAIFNVLQGRFEESSVLDLCAGTCVFSMEAISRGAKYALAVEQNFALCEHIKKNVKKHSWSQNLEILCADVKDFVEKCERKFDIIYFDPPYYENELSVLAKKMTDLCVDGGVVAFEFAGDDKFVIENYADYDFRKYGKSSVLFMKKEKKCL
jgi:16S rRNA (guanine966-N2)-methyltransferase